jgi:hypothetical protein
MQNSPWVAERDPTSGKDFYYNNNTGETTWQIPYGFGQPAAQTSSWISEVDPASGDTFYVNEATGESTWEQPPDFYGNIDDLRNERPKSGGGPKKELSSKWKRAFAKVRVMVALNQKFKPPSWEKHFDDETGEFFYHNTVTGKSQWTEPESFIRSLPATKSPSAKANRNFFQNDNQDNEGEKRPGSRGSTGSRRPGSRSSTRPGSRGSTSSKSPDRESKETSTSDRREKKMKKKKKNKMKDGLDITPVIEAVEAADMDAMLEAMDKCVAAQTNHRGRSLFSGARDATLQDATLEEEEEENKKEENITITKKERKNGEEEEEEEEEKPKIISEKAKNMYRVREYKKKRFQPIINEKDSRGRTALHVACERGNEQIIRKLIELGADLNVRDKSLNSPLHLAVQKSHLRCVYILLRDGADPSLRTKWGQSPYDVAKYKNYMKICRLFENGEKEFDIVELFVDRKWYQVDVHLVRHGKKTTVPIDDTVFYVKTKYRTKAHVHHPDLH